MRNLSLFEADQDQLQGGLVVVSPVIDHAVRGLCRQPYPLHPKGCPNFGSADRCPPAAPFFEEVFDLTRPVYAVVNEFDIGAHVARMAASHPTWSDRQLRCVLYWQPRARKELDARIRHALSARSCRGYAATWCPEGMGVDVTATMMKAGIHLEWPPAGIARQIAFLAAPKLL